MSSEVCAGTHNQALVRHGGRIRERKQFRQTHSRDSSKAYQGLYQCLADSIEYACLFGPLLALRVRQVFDTCNVHNDQAFGLDFHIDRLLRSAAGARIEHNYTKETLRGIILATIAAGGRKEGVDAFAKYWLSAGRYCGCSSLLRRRSRCCQGSSA